MAMAQSCVQCAKEQALCRSTKGASHATRKQPGREGVRIPVWLVTVIAVAYLGLGTLLFSAAKGDR